MSLVQNIGKFIDGFLNTFCLKGKETRRNYFAALAFKYVVEGGAIVHETKSSWDKDGPGRFRSAPGAESPWPVEGATSNKRSASSWRRSPENG